MNRRFLEALLPLIEHPSHYLGSEINAIVKDPKETRLRVALAFPDLYELGMSYLGIQILYHGLNRQKGVAAERVFAPSVDLEAELRHQDMPLCSLETHTPLSAFDIIGFSLLYELNYTNIVTMLELAPVPVFARDREDDHPLVIAGGPCTFNPEPVADFFDALVIGDGEEVLVALAKAWMEWKEGGGDRQALLKSWSGIQGVYVPSFFEAQRDEAGFQRLTPRVSGYTSVQKALITDINLHPCPTQPIIPYGKPIHDRLSLEVCRGCTRGCRFCQAGMIYRPVRERDPSKLLPLADEALMATGYEDISLLSLSTGDYGPLQGVMESLMRRCEPEKIAVSLPSLRVGSLTEPIMEQIKRVRKTGFTIAPEAASQRLRDVINKNISEEELIENLRLAFGLGWRLVKLYFMIGLPSETEEDIEGIGRLVRKLQKSRAPGGKRGDITVSVSTFIPKAHTAFQWCGQVSLEESREKIRLLKHTLRGKGIRFKWQNPEMSVLEGLWARGDRRLSRLLVRAHELGCRFDGWSDQFHFDRWQQAMEAAGIHADFFSRAKDVSEPLPWDHIDCGVTREFLEGEWERALQGIPTEDCRHGQCHQCGVCDFKSVAPVTFDPHEQDGSQKRLGDMETPEVYKKLTVSYEKRGQARFFGHLEMVKILLRAFRRARIPLRFSEGFHPAPKVSFDTALPVGMESTAEDFTIEVPLSVSPSSILKTVNKTLPTGLKLTACNVVFQKPSRKTRAFRYTVTLKEGTFSEDKRQAFLKSPTWVLERKNKKGRIKTVNLKDMVTTLDILSPMTAQMTLDFSSGNHVRPTDILDNVFCLSKRQVKLAGVVKEPLS